MAARLVAAGLPGGGRAGAGPGPRKGNLVARLRGTGTPPAAPAARAPRRRRGATRGLVVRPVHVPREGGYFYGRGTSDDKAMAAIFVANLIRYKQEGFRPDRDLILALTADEEGGAHNGVDWLLTNHRELVDAELGAQRGRRRPDRRTDAASRTRCRRARRSTRLPARGDEQGRPQLAARPDNAIYQLADALARSGATDFPVRLNEVTRAFFERSAATGRSRRRRHARPWPGTRRTCRGRAALGAALPTTRVLRTTCVATLLEGGHAENALPQTARATVNCRILPDEKPEDVQGRLVAVARRPADRRHARRRRPSPARRRPSTADVMRPIERVTRGDVAGRPGDPDHEHGRDRRPVPPGRRDSRLRRRRDLRATWTTCAPTAGTSAMAVKSFYEGQEFLYRLVKALSE